MSQAVIYARKSTESEDRQVLSIDSQIKELKDLAEKLGIKIKQVFTESKSAKSPGRPVFAELMDLVQKNKINEIVCWKLDRLARNPVDGGGVIWAMDERKLSKIHTPQNSFRNSSSDKFWMQMEFGMAKKYVDDLSDNVKRGLRAKLERGWLPGVPPMGYMNDKQTKTVIKDPKRFQTIRKMWELMLTGDYSPPHVLRIATNQWGLRKRQFRTSGGGPVGISTVYDMFSNPFYYGVLTYGGEHYSGSHEPMISKEEFDLVRQIMSSKSRKRPKRYFFKYTGLIQCGECGAAVTAEHKTNRFGSKYIYYHCARRNRGVSCSQKATEEQSLEEQIQEFLASLRISKRLKDWALNALDSMNEGEVDHRKQIQVSLQKGISNCERELSELLNLKIRNLLSDTEYISKKNELHNEVTGLKERMSRPSSKTKSDLEQSRKIFQFAESACDSFTNGDASTKRDIFVFTGSNPKLTNKKLRIEAQKPLERIRQFSLWYGSKKDKIEPAIRGLYNTRTVPSEDGSCALLGVVEDVRTYFSTN